MQKHIRVINCLVAVAAMCLILASPFPGSLGGWFVCLMVPVLAILGIAWFHVLAASHLRDSPHFRSVPRSRFAVVPVVIGLTFCTLYFYLPRRLVFVACRGRFDQFVANAPKTDRDGVPLDKRLGVYHIDRYVAGPNGTVYLRTGESGDVDVSSFGFVYRPNSTRTPFGHSCYQQQSLGNGWYAFEVIDRF